MQISVFTSEVCPNCDEVKEQLNAHNLKYREFEANDALNPSAKGFFEKYPDWRTSGIFEALALSTYDDTLPITVIDGKAHTFKEAKKLLSKMSDNAENSKTVFVDFSQHEVEESTEVACVAAM